MNVLVVGAGVVGTVYGAHLAADGHAVSVLAHGARTDEVAAHGLVARDLGDGNQVASAVDVVPDPARAHYDVVLVAVRRDQLASAFDVLTSLRGRPVLLFLGNNPAGHAAVPPEIAAQTWWGFPGIGGCLVGGTAQFVRIPQQPTTLEAGCPRIDEIEASLRRCGFAVQRVNDMDGWLAYHAVFVACVAAALYRCGCDPARLAADRRTMRTMCEAITAGFASLREQGLGGLPRNLAVLHHPAMRPVAVRYWTRAMRSPMGELCFAAHARHAEPEMRALGSDVMARAGVGADVVKLEQILTGQFGT